mgnify:CR=1 FL=1
MGDPDGQLQSRLPQDLWRQLQGVQRHRLKYIAAHALSRVVDGLLQHLIERGSRVIVEAERELRVAGRRLIPDLTLRCPKSGEIRLLIEVWHTHAVSVAISPP